MFPQPPPSRFPNDTGPPWPSPGRQRTNMAGSRIGRSAWPIQWHNDLQNLHPGPTIYSIVSAQAARKEVTFWATFHEETPVPKSTTCSECLLFSICRKRICAIVHRQRPDFPHLDLFQLFGPHQLSQVCWDINGVDDVLR